MDLAPDVPKDVTKVCRGNEGEAERQREPKPSTLHVSLVSCCASRFSQHALFDQATDLKETDGIEDGPDQDPRLPCSHSVQP